MNHHRIATLLQGGNRFGIAGVVPLGVRAKTDGVQNQRPRAAVGSDFLQRFLRRGGDLQHVAGVQLGHRDAEGGEA